jgi:type I restriction enzyme, R subunit
LNKKQLSERDICTKYITPALEAAGWNKHTQFLEEVSFTAGKIYVRGKLAARGQGKRADYILYYKPNIPIAIIEAKDNNYSVRAGIQQALDYAQILDIPCVFSSNGDGFLFHDRSVGQDLTGLPTHSQDLSGFKNLTGLNAAIEQELPLDQFPSPADLWERYKRYKGIATTEAERIAAQDYYTDGSGRHPRYYQQIAINRTVEAIAKGQQRLMLVMATGTGKTYTAFQIVWRLWKSGVKKRILFLADRNALISQTKRGDFKHFGEQMTVVKNGKVDKAYEVYLALYQGLSTTTTEESSDSSYPIPHTSYLFKEFSPDFFDLIVIDECHRGSASADSAWREILDYFTGATQLGLTATPRETHEASNYDYFGEPIYTYSLRQGINDGFLAPYRTVRIGINVDLEGWRPEKNKTDKDGNPVEDRIYNTRDFDRSLVIDERTDVVAQKVTEFLKGLDRMAKTIVFCQDIDHAERMRSALANWNKDLVAINHKYVMQITGDNDEGKRELDNFINPQETYPVIATTSELMTTGVDAQTCQVIVLDANINSMTKFKQIIGRGTRINEEYGKMYFTILDFRNVTDLFADPAFDGDPIVPARTYHEDEDLSTIIDEEQEALEDIPVIDEETGTVLEILPPKTKDFFGEPPTTKGYANKVYVNGVDVTVLISRELHFDNDGKPITTSLKDHARQLLTGQYASLDAFLSRWNSAERKQALLEELAEQGIPVETLRSAVDSEVDLFDLICHVAYDQPPLTRRERALNVKKRDYFTKYGEQARRVLEALLDKYADEGIENLESLDVLKVRPLTQFGSPIEILREFGGKERFLAAVRELEGEIYRVA